MLQCDLLLAWEICPYFVFQLRQLALSSQSFIIKFKCSVQPALARAGLFQETEQASRAVQSVYLLSNWELSSYKIYSWRDALHRFLLENKSGQTNILFPAKYSVFSLPSPTSSILPPQSSHWALLRVFCWCCWDRVSVSLLIKFIIFILDQWNEYRN